MLGLNFLTEHQVDQAIEELTAATSTDTDALEIQMILGNLFRQKGQVARAITVHQALLQRTNLTRLEHAYVLLCLRSEEHTSELQSQSNLVCRLLLEKKKINRLVMLRSVIRYPIC